ncbi:MAG: hypothetical protein HYY18_02485 [Planctomycetes bacterium]|nr:hypothetical protein [Planctomycetota bacterium]
MLSGSAPGEAELSGTVLLRIALSRQVEVVEVGRMTDPLHEATVVWESGNVRILK